MSKLLKILFSILLSRDIEAIENHLTKKRDEYIEVYYWKFKIIYKLSNLLKAQNVWLVFFIDNRAKIVLTSDLDVSISIKSYFWLSKSKFKFLPSTTQFIPDNQHAKNSFMNFLFSELKDHPILNSFTVIMFLILKYINTNLNLIEKLASINITTITIFISIYLVLFALNFNSKTSVNDFFTGVYQLKYEFNKNTYYLSLLSLTTSIISIIIVNIDVEGLSASVVNLSRLIGRYNLATTFAVISIMFTYISLLNIVHYYLKLNREQYYADSINKIIDDQQKLVQKRKVN